MAVDTSTRKSAAAAPAPGKPVRRRSSVALKIFMAVTGFLLVAFLYVHMIGNLKIFFGEETFDHYAHWLRSIGTPLLPEAWYLYIQRTVLTVAVIGHIVAAVILTRRARQARPVKYAHRPKVQGSYAARTMRWGGVIVLLFVIYHILDLTTLTLNPHGVTGEVYRNVAEDFAPSRWYVTLFYTLSIVAVGFHLRHGLWSAVRTLGLQSPRGEVYARATALVLSVVLVVGYLSVPFAVLVGLVD
ncbi:succinate dehydrogenase cytochrome b subunit [Paractinoplanes lichenicola]|uniref:Succinate dehydrogenase cytochrome b subunit n=1 Tax=Paractinoplanes lichenicola TaxID=2802976 RepID=A0ABS1VP90_9ACTN|nr:succinate dehydrogenase cytochrome b subunit [Actinoplanes lichenicola]MBL7256538.1 succinate dehydrogenase cytochrome b subunit [Actinoplanes lichenicola]